MSTEALSGLKVIELSEFISGPYCGKLMADLGAEVIKIEKPGLGDKARSYGPFPDDIPHPEKSGLFLFLNTNKQGITLNIKTATGLKIFKDLIKQADVLIDDHLPHEAKELGIKYEVLSEINPKLIMTSITPFGQTGPYKNYKSCDLINMNMGGEAFFNPTGGVDDPATQPPLKHPAHLGHYRAGITAGLGTLSGVLAQRMSGLGQHVDVSEQESIASVARREISIYTYEGVNYTRDKGNKGMEAALLPCKDGHIVIVLNTDAFWSAAVDMIGNPDWANEEWCQDLFTRRANWDAIAALISEWTKEHTKQEVYQASQVHRIPCSPVQTAGQFVDSELLASREFFTEINRKEVGTIKYPGAPYKFSATPWTLRIPAPLLGEHNEEIFCRRLGYTKEDLTKLKQTGII